MRRVVIAICAATLVACSAFWHEAEKAGSDLFTCLVANQDLPDEDALLKCGAKTLSDELQAQAVDFLQKARADSAKRMAQAHDRGAHETKEALANAGCLKDGGK